MCWSSLVFLPSCLTFTWLPIRLTGSAYFLLHVSCSLPPICSRLFHFLCVRVWSCEVSFDLFWYFSVFVFPNRTNFMNFSLCLGSGIGLAMFTLRQDDPLTDRRRFWHTFCASSSLKSVSQTLSAANAPSTWAHLLGGSVSSGFQAINRVFWNLEMLMSYVIVLPCTGCVARKPRAFSPHGRIMCLDHEYLWGAAAGTWQRAVTTII